MILNSLAEILSFADVCLSIKSNETLSRAEIISFADVFKSIVYLNDTSTLVVSISISKYPVEDGATLFLATLALRTGTGEWVDNLTAYIILAVCGLLLTLLLVLGKFNDKSKLICIGSSVLLIIALVGTAVYSAFNAYSFVGIDCSKDYETVFLTAFVCAFIIIILLNVLFFFAQKAILNEVEEEMDMDKYELYRKDYLLNMYSFAKEQLELRRETITVYDPLLILNESKYSNMALKRSIFDSNQDVSKYDIITGILPCEATEEIIKAACFNKKDF